MKLRFAITIDFGSETVTAPAPAVSPVNTSAQPALQQVPPSPTIKGASPVSDFRSGPYL